MQRYRAVILIVVFGVLPLVVAFFAALSYLQGQGQEEAGLQPATAVVETPPPEPEPEPARVLAAARDLPIGALVRDADLTELAVPAESVHGTHLLADEGAAASRLRGYAVRKPVASGAALTRSALIAPWEQGFLAAVLEPGTRAVTIRVDPATSHAGLIDPGDRVDVILTAEVSIVERERAVFTRTIVEDVRVVAADRRFGEASGLPPGSDADAENAGAAPAREEMITATLEVSPVQGNRLVIAEHEGRLSLALRALAAAGAEPRTSHSAVQLQEVLLPSSPASPAENEEPAAPLVTTVRVYRGNRPAEVVTFGAGVAAVPAGTAVPGQVAGTSPHSIGARGYPGSADGSRIAPASSQR